MNISCLPTDLFTQWVTTGRIKRSPACEALNGGVSTIASIEVATMGHSRPAIWNVTESARITLFPKVIPPCFWMSMALMMESMVVAYEWPIDRNRKTPSLGEIFGEDVRPRSVVSGSSHEARKKMLRK